jgi:hypothetical protein
MTVLRKSQETKLNITVGKRPPPPKNDDATKNERGEPIHACA